MPSGTLIMAAIAVLVIPAAPIPAVIALLPVGAVAGIGTAIAVIAIRSVVAGVVPALTMAALADPATAVLTNIIDSGLPAAMIPISRERRAGGDRDGRKGRERRGRDHLAQHGNSSSVARYISRQGRE